jgi:hypothetical protein
MAHVEKAGQANPEAADKAVRINWHLMQSS